MESQETSRISDSKQTIQSSENNASTVLWLIGAGALYFIIQLWILPAFGIPT